MRGRASSGDGWRRRWGGAERQGAVAVGVGVLCISGGTGRRAAAIAVAGDAATVAAAAKA